MASASLSRSISSSPTNPDKFTVSMWVKRTGQGAEQVLLGNYSSSNFRGKLQFKSNDKIEYYQVNDGNATAQLRTTRVFRDPNAWYHLLVQFDTSQGTASDRIKIYINGTQETSFDISSYPAQNLDMRPNQPSTTLHIGQDGNSGNYLDAELAHVHLADGQTYAPTVFAETDATTGIWKPKVSPSVTYGDDGFFLKFDNSANMGLDSSGNSNNFSTSGTIIQTKDTPDNVFCTNNKLWFQESTRVVTLSNVNNMLSGGGSSTWYQVPGTLAFSKGKYYWECKFNAATNLDKNTAGVIDIEKTNETGQFQDKTGSVFFKNEDGGDYRLDASTVNSNWGTLAQNDILSVAVDMDAATPTVKFYKNGTLLGTVNASSFSGKTVTPAQTVYTSGEYQVNYGNGYFGTTAVSSAQNPSDGVGVFEYSVPSGYKALCTKSINAQEYS